MPIDYLASLPGGEMPSPEPRNTTDLTVVYASQPAAPTVSAAKVDTPSPQSGVQRPEKSKFLKMTTDFRTLKYSGDRPSNGTSQLPYIQAPLERDWNIDTPVKYLDITSPGGSLKLLNIDDNNTPTTLQLHQSMDTARISGFLQTSQKGKLFTANQKILQFQNPKTEVGTTLNFAPTDTENGPFWSQVWNRLKNTTSALEYTRVYNDNQNLLTQIEAAGTGNYYDRAGNYPVTPASLKYYQIVKNKDTNKNRLVVLRNSKIKTDNEGQPLDLAITAELIKLGISSAPNSLFNYLGGPTSTDTSTSTLIQRYDFTDTWSAFAEYNGKYPYKGEGYLGRFSTTVQDPTATLNDNTFGRGPRDTRTAGNPGITIVKGVPRGGDALTNTKIAPPEYNPTGKQTLHHRAYATSSFQVENFIGSEATTSPLNRPYALTYSELLDRSATFNLTSDIRPDFRELVSGIPDTKGYEGDTGEGFLAKQYGAGNPGSSKIARFDYKLVGYQGKGVLAPNDQGVDSINATDVITDPKDAGGTDLIKCIIRPVENGLFGKISDTILVFKALISNFSDNINATWAEHTYVGRGEKFYTYQVGERKVSFQLAVAAQSRAEMKPLYRKINYLISQLYPDYVGLNNKATSTGFMKSPLAKITIGDYFYNTPVILTGLNIQIPEDSPWEIDSANFHNGDPKSKPWLSNKGDMYQLPHYLTLNIQCTPIHNFVPRRASILNPFKKTDTWMNDNYYIPPFITPHEEAITSEDNDVVQGKNRFNIG